MKPNSLECVRRLASGMASTMGLLGLLAIAPPASATVNGVSVTPFAPSPCDSVTITVTGSLSDNCYEVVGATIVGPGPIPPCMRPTPCPSMFDVEITVRQPNPIIARSCLVGPFPYTRSFNVGKLAVGDYGVSAHERVIPFSPDSTDSVVAESFASGVFSVGPDSSCTVPPCYLLGFEDLNVPPTHDPCLTSAPPGGTACLILGFSSTGRVGGLQTTLEASGPDSLTPTDAFLHAISVDPRGPGYQVGWATEGSRTKLILYSVSGAPLPQYLQVRICYSIAPETVSQMFRIATTATLVSDPAGNLIAPCPTLAQSVAGICVGSPSCDVNGDGASDVLDIIRIVRCALGTGVAADSIPACPDSIAARADCNEDGSIDIRDVICCVRKIVEVPSGLGQPIPTLQPLSGTIPAGENSISFEGAPRWINAVDGFATVRIETAENWGGTQFVINPMGAPVRIRGLYLDAASVRAGSDLESAIDGSGIAHAVLVQTAADVRSAQTYRVLVRLERAPSDAGSGTVRIQGVKAGTSEGLAAGIALFNPTFDVDPETSAAPALLAAHPNPTSGQTEIGFTLPADGRAALRVYDVAGRLVRTLAEGPMTAGVHRARWDGLDTRGRAARSGIYFAKLEFGKTLRSERILLMR